MSNLVVESTPEGLKVPADVLARAGVSPGTRLELVVLPGSDEIHHRAVRHTVWKLGDMIRVARPEVVSDEWVVDLWSHDNSRRIGRLYFDSHGELIADKSSTREALG